MPVVVFGPNFFSFSSFAFSLEMSRSTQLKGEMLLNNFSKNASIQDFHN